MFSHEGLALDSETLEYAWLVEAVIGDVSGRLTCPQVGKVTHCYGSSFKVEWKHTDMSLSNCVSVQYYNKS